MYTHVLISTDGSELAQRGVDHGLSLAKKLGSKVTIVVATEPFLISTEAAREIEPGVGAGSRGFCLAVKHPRSL